MKISTWRLIIGGFLILGGLLVLLQEFGILSGAANLFWVGLLLAGGITFLGVFATDRRHWWALIPGMTLVGMGLVSLLPSQYTYLGGTIFLSAIGISFWCIYIFGTNRWWAIIPGGVLLTLAAVSSLGMAYGQQFFGFRVDEWVSGSIFFLGLAITFFLVAVLPKPQGLMSWAFIPAAALFLMSLAVATLRLQQLMIYVWPVVLIVAGVYMVYLYFRSHRVE
jgi:hypothetical protein